jgi:hypothetical protein
MRQVSLRLLSFCLTQYVALLALVLVLVLKVYKHFHRR